jgi:hypothetical protein
MTVYKYNSADIKQNGKTYIVRTRQADGTHGIYTIHEVDKRSIYHVTIEHGEFHGDIRLWISDEENNVVEFSPKYALSKSWKTLDYYINTGKLKKLKIGLMFHKPTNDDFFEFISVKLKKANLPTKNKRLAIIVPYRDRLEHMKEFVPHMNEYLKEFDSQIFIIHQFNDNPFNRAGLMNIGFDIIKDHFDYFCFHDIDMLPEASSYSVPESPTHMSMYCSQFDYRRKIMFGGVVIFTKEQFQEVNGFSNLYQGWGAEDNDMYLRVKRLYKPIYRPGRYRSLPHQHNGSNHPNYKQNVKLYHNRKDNPDLLKNEGLSDLHGSFPYKILQYSKITNESDVLPVDKLEYKNKHNFMVNVDF